MNIFASFSCPRLSALSLDNKRVVKMILESAQLLSTARHGPLKPTHVNHPCTRWVAEDQDNYAWLWAHAGHLLDRYREVYGKGHAYTSLINHTLGPSLGRDDYLVPKYFVNCTPLKDREVHEAYRLCLEAKWAVDKRPPKWGTETAFPGWENISIKTWSRNLDQEVTSDVG